MKELINNLLYNLDTLTFGFFSIWIWIMIIMLSYLTVKLINKLIENKVKQDNSIKNDKRRRFIFFYFLFYLRMRLILFSV